MRLGKSLIEFERFFRGGSGLWNRVLRSGRAKDREQRVRVGEPGVGTGIAGIFLDRLIEISDGFAQIRAGPLVPKESAFEVKLVCLAIIGRNFRYRFQLRAR